MSFHSVLPLIGLRSPAELWTNESPFLLGELLFYFLLTFLLIRISLTSFVSRPCKERLRASPASFAVAALVGSFAGGAGIELATILSTEIGNFYHSQSMVQLFGLREPLYMLFGCYCWLPCFSILLSRKPGPRLPRFAECCLAGLLCSYLWGMLDTIGLKFLWWTWHTDDPLYEGRILGVPAASTFWIFVSTVCLSFVLNWAEDSGWFMPAKRRPATIRMQVLTAVLIGLMAGPLAFLVLMHVPFLVFYHPIVTFGGYSSVWALHACRGFCIFAIFHCLRDHKLTWSLRRLLGPDALQLAVFFSVMLGIAIFADPTQVTRTSFGQPLGPCDAVETAFWGAFNRSRYLCPSKIIPERDHFALSQSSYTEAVEGTEWYTLVGVAREATWLNEAIIQSLLGLSFALVALCVRVGKIEKPEEPTDDSMKEKAE